VDASGEPAIERHMRAVVDLGNNSDRSSEENLILVDAWATHGQRAFTASALRKLSSRATFFKKKN
jgi:hypothetical protein